MGAKELNSAQQELFDAVRKGDVEKIQTWLSNKRNRRPRTPLNFLRPATPQAAWLCSMVDPSNGYTVLHLAALQGHTEVVKILLDVDSHMATAKDRRGCLPVHLASWNGHVGAVQALIDSDPDTVDAVNNAKESSLHLSAQHGHGKVVSALLTMHADARLRNARAETALDIAARLGRANVCRLIICSCPELALQSAADCSSTDSSRSRHLSQVAYPLHAAARHGHVDCLQILCQSGFDLNFVTEEGSALHVAALFGKVDAVRLLLHHGVDVDIRDAQGRTVLETLDEHENEKALDLTQVIQSREGWSECRKAIEAAILQRKADCSRDSSVGSNASQSRWPCCSVYQNTTIHARSGADCKDVVWRPVPEGSAVRRSGDEVCSRYSSNRGSVRGSANGIYHPPSLVADFVTIPIEDHEFDDASTLSLSTTLPDHSENDSSGHPSPSSGSVAGTVVSSTARFPLSSPSTKNRNSFSSRCGVLPRMGIARTSITLGAKGGVCPYQARARGPLLAHTCDLIGGAPLLAYDNVPRNLLVYDNAPLGQRRWDHTCPSTSNYTGSIGYASGQNMCAVRSDGTQTMPAVKQSRQRAPLYSSTFIPQPTSCHGQTQGASDLNPDCTTTSQRPQSRESVITFACSTLERSVSPDGATETPSATSSLAHGRAPLALPEDMCGSTSTSILSMSVSPERWIPPFETAQWRRSGTVTDETCGSDRTSSSTVGPSISTQATAINLYEDELRKFSDVLTDGSQKNNGDLTEIDQNAAEIGHPPSPETTQTRIHNFLCSHDELRRRLSLSPASNKAQQTQVGALSPSTTDCSDCTLASTCSLPVISQLSSTSPSVVSPTRERSEVFKQFSAEEPCASSAEVKLRVQLPRNDFLAHRGALLESSFASEGLSEKSSLDKNWALSRFDEEESQKLCVEPSNRDMQQASLNESSEWRKPTTTLVADWLNVSVGIPNPRAKEVASVLENHGFDSISHMQSTLDRVAMQEIGLDKSTQHQIGTYLENYPGSNLSSANTFTYVSDWLHSLDLADHLGHFMNAGLTSMLIVCTVDPSVKHLKSMGITQMGHQRRILNSLRDAKVERQQRTAERIAALSRDEDVENGHECRAAAQPSSSALKSHSIIVGGRPTEWRHSSTTLIEDCVSYSAHYLGSMEISNVEGTEDSRRAMIKLKKGIREIAKVPQVVLEISVSGVRVLDATTKQLTVEHEITRIQIVCQDERDLNCFAYISQDGDKHFCHVFCVLTADVATEIIITLGQAFEVCYRIANGTYGDSQPIAINPVA